DGVAHRIALLLARSALLHGATDRVLRAVSSGVDLLHGRASPLALAERALASRPRVPDRADRLGALLPLRSAQTLRGHGRALLAARSRSAGLDRDRGAR